MGNSQTALFVVLFLCINACAKEIPALSADKIVTKANIAAYYQASDGRAKVNMEIVNSRGDVKVREFIILRKDITDGGDQKFYVYFQRPADIRRMVFMVHKHVDKENEDDRWLYLPSLDLVNRIASGDKRTSFVGSDYFYEDVSGRSLSADTHELLAQDEEYYIVRNIPKYPEEVEFSYYDMNIDKQTFLPMSILFYDKKQVLYRKIEVVKSGEVQLYPTVFEVLVTNLSTKNITRMRFSQIKYDIDLPDIFSERYLRRPPRKFLR